jgi:hypothetical protein
VSGRGLIAGAVAASLALVLTSLALGGASYEPKPVQDPCKPREWRSPSGLDAIAQQITLSTLDGAACDLHVSRETLVLALATPQGREHFINDPHLGDALRAGLLRSVDDAEHAGAIPGIVADGLRQVIQGLPADQIVEAARNASTLFGDAQDVLGQIENFFNGL